MPFNRYYLLFILALLTIAAIAGCDTSRLVYKNSDSKKDYWTINAVTLTHCGCTELYVDHFKSGKKDFQLFYSDKLARKTLFEYDNNKTLKTTTLLATTRSDYTTPFDKIDLDIFRNIDSVIINKTGLVYSIQRTEYKGFINDTTYIRHN